MKSPLYVVWTGSMPVRLSWPGTQVAPSSTVQYMNKPGRSPAGDSAPAGQRVTGSGPNTFRRGLRVLDALQKAGAEGLHVVEVARAAGLERSTVYRFLDVLLETGYATRDPLSRRFYPVWPELVWGAGSVADGIRSDGISADRSSADRVSPDRVSADRVPAARAASGRAAPGHVSPGRVSPGRTSPDAAAPGGASPDTLSPGRDRVGPASRAARSISGPGVLADSATHATAISRWAPALRQISAATGDSTFLVCRAGNDSLCLHREVGTYPVQVLAVTVGHRQPLGVGAAGLAYLAALPVAEADAVIEQNADALRAYGGMTTKRLRQLAAAARDRGWAVIGNSAVPGVIGVGVALTDPAGRPLLAVSVSGLLSRMPAARQRRIAQLIRETLRAPDASMPAATQI